MTGLFVSLLRLVAGGLAGVGVVVTDDWVVQTAGILAALAFWALTKYAPDWLGKFFKK